MKPQKLLIVVATTNPKKHKELVELLADLPIRVKSLTEFPGIREVEEDGKTFRENAEKKALGYAKQTGCLTLAEDSGLCVDYLSGAPGIRSARFAGEERDDRNNCRKLLEALKEVPGQKRHAAFKCAAAIALPEKVLAVVEEEIQGVIAQEMQGTNGFGYDPLFFYPGFGTTFGEVSADRKHSVSHRGKALRRIREILNESLEINK